MYWLPKIYKTLVGVRFVVASYYCSTNPVSDTIPKMIFNTVESFHKKVCFIQAVRNSGLCKILFQQPPCQIKSMSRKNLFQLLTVAPYIQPSYINFSQKFLQKLSIFSSNLKSENALASLKHLSTGLLGTLEEDTLLNKLLPMLYLFS